MAPEFYPADPPARTMTPAERRAADLQALADAEVYGEKRRNGEIRDPGCDSVSSWLPTFLAENPTAAAALRRDDEVARRAQ